MSDYTHDDAMRDLDYLATVVESDRQAKNRRKARNHILAYIERLEQERNQWKQELTGCEEVLAGHIADWQPILAERDHWQAVARVLAENCEDFDAGFRDKDADFYITWAEGQVRDVTTD